MSNGPDEARRRQLKGDYKNAERTAWLAGLPLDEERHEALLDQPLRPAMKLAAHTAPVAQG